MVNPETEPENQAPDVTPSPYQFWDGFTLSAKTKQYYVPKTSFKTIAMIINRPSQCEIVQAWLHQGFLQFVMRYKGHWRRRRFNVLVNKADVIDPFVWATEDPRELIIEVLNDLASRRELLSKHPQKREHPDVTVIQRYSVKPPNSINNHSVAVFECKSLPGIQFKLDKTLDAVPPHYELRTMENQIIPVLGQEYWSGLRRGSCLSWHKAFTTARIFAIGYWKKLHPEVQ